jgi:hypothetical protein
VPQKCVTQLQRSFSGFYSVLPLEFAIILDIVVVVVVVVVTT